MLHIFYATNKLSHINQDHFCETVKNGLILN